MALVAARIKRPMHTESSKAKIQVAMIIDRFQKCMRGEIELSMAQVSVGKALLNKVLPDLSSVQAKTENKHVYVTELPNVIPTTDEWLKAQRKPSLQ